MKITSNFLVDTLKSFVANQNVTTVKNSNKWALITGASSGIGKEFAYQLAAKGYNLVLVARRIHLLEEIANLLRERFGTKSLLKQLDLSLTDACEELFEFTREVNLELIVSNAGTGAPGEFIGKNMSDMLNMVQTSVIAHLKITHHYGKLLCQKRGGGIILASAMGAKNGLPFMSNDAGTRAYIRSLGLGLHEEFKRYNVKLTVLETTPTVTPIVAELGFDEESMPLKPITVEKCVTVTLRALEKNKPIAFPGSKFKILNKIMPPKLVRSMNGKMLAKGNGIQWKLTPG